MKRVLLVVPFVLAACGGSMTDPQEGVAAVSSSMSAKGGSCTIPGKGVVANGFDAFGYNRCAGLFNGSADGVDNKLDGAVWGDAIYANDHLVMKWNAAWDACNANRSPENCAGAWEDNEWNGKVAGGSGQTWHYKIVWSAACAANETLTDGGYCLWGSYEVLMDQGQDPNVGPGHIWFAHANPSGYGN